MWTRMVNGVGPTCRRMSLIALLLFSPWSSVDPVRAESPRTAGNVRLPTGDVLDRHGGRGASGRATEPHTGLGEDVSAMDPGRPRTALPGPDVLGPGKPQEPAAVVIEDVPGEVVDAEDLGEQIEADTGQFGAGESGAGESGAGEFGAGQPGAGVLRYRASPPGTSDPNRVLQEGGRSSALGGGATWRHMVPLLLVLGLIILVATVIRRFTPVRRMLTGAGVVDIVARTPVSAKQTLVLVKMGQRLVLVGVCPDRLSALAEVDDPDEVAGVLGQAASSQGGSIREQFAEAFGEQVSAYAEPPTDEAVRSGGHVRSLLEKVRTLAQGSSGV
jgi:flagellar biogenesis protein FliO